MRASSARLSLAAGLLLVTASAVSGQVRRGEIQVLVTDATGLPLHASGTLVSEAPQTYRTFATNNEGRFTFERLPFGVYRVIVERTGFIPHSELVDVRSALPKTLRVELSLAPLDTQITVSDERPLVDPQSMAIAHTIGAPEIRDHMPVVPGRRLLELVDAQPGWLMEANGVLHPRGSEYQTLFVVDGVPMDENRSPAMAPDLQDGEVLAVAVLTGNFPAEYGRKLGGVVEVTTARDIRSGFHGAAEIGAGSFGTAAGSFSGAYGWADRAVAASVSAARTDRYLDPPVLSNFTNTGSLRGARGSYDDRPSDRDRLHFAVHHRRSTFLIPNEHVQQIAGQRQEAAGRETLAQAAWTRILSSQYVFNARGVVERLSATLRSNQSSIPVAVSLDRSFTRAYANASVAAALGRHQIKFGGDAVFAPVRERLEYRITAPAFFEEGTALEFQFSDRRRDREQSLFVQDAVTLGRLTVSAGLRWDRYELVVKDDAFSPRLAVAWAWPDADLVLRAAYDRVFQTPAIENLLLASSPLVDQLNPVALRLPVRPSRGNFVEGSLTAGLARRARLDVAAYRRTFSDFADDDVFLNTGVSFPGAFAAADVRGVDSKLTLPPWGRLSGFLSYSLLKGTAELPVVGGLFLGEEAVEDIEASGKVAITQDQRHTLRAQARYQITPRIWSAATVRYGSGLPVELDEETDTDALEEQYGAEILRRVDLEHGRVRPNLSLDVGLGAVVLRRDTHRVALRVELANLTDRLNVINFAGLFSGTAVAPPRSISVRMQYEF
jgi:hypothetical protein